MENMFLNRIKETVQIKINNHEFEKLINEIELILREQIKHEFYDSVDKALEKKRSEEYTPIKKRSKK